MGTRTAGPMTVPVPGTGPGVLLMANSSVAPFLLFVNKTPFGVRSCIAAKRTVWHHPRTASGVRRGRML